MTEKINIETIKYLEGLMKISISDQKRQEFLPQLTNIIDHFEDIKSVNINSIQEDTFFLNKNTVREDSHNNNSNEHKNLALKNAPDILGDYYKVLKVIK